MTVPFPDPAAPVTVIHDALETAFHAQPPGSVTLALKFPPAAEAFCVAGDKVASQGAPVCVMTNDWPAMVSVVERELLSGFAAMAYPTLPFPVPELVVVKVTHEAGLVALQPHAAPAVMAMLPVPDVDATEALEGEMLYPHPAACVIVTAWPATVSTPERDCEVAFAATEYETVPDPVPLAPDVIDIQDTALEAFQAQPAVVVTETLPVPPAVAALAVVGFTV